MKKIIIIIIILIAGGFFAINKYKANDSVVPVDATIEEKMMNDTSEATIGEELDNIDVGVDDSQFNDVEADLQNL